MKLSFPSPPAASQQANCPKWNAWIAEAGWRLRCQLSQYAKAGKVPPVGPTVVAISAPKALGCAFEAHAGPVIELLHRHGAIAATGDIHGIALVWHDQGAIDVALEPAPLRSGTGTSAG